MNEYIIEPERKLRVETSCDVLVAGGGIAGIAAAMAAARGGKDVILLEREYALGGMATLGLVTIYLPLCDGEGRQLVYGIGEELLKLSIRHGAEANYPKAWLENGSLEERVAHRYITQFNPHLFALSCEELLCELGVRILYGSVACAAAKDGNRVSAVVVENKSGRSAIAVGSVIDCTGDADICALSGAETALHTGGNGLASWYYYYSEGKNALKMFGLADVVPDADTGNDTRVRDIRSPADMDHERVPNTMAAKAKEDAYKAVKVESLDENIRFSGVDGEELSRAVISAHGKMYEDILAAHEKDPDYVPVTISTIPLVRMSRRLVGAYEMDVRDDHVRMTDSIGMTGDWRKRGPAFEIPFRTLYGHEVTNLLAAGRDISVTDAMWDITRVIPPCAVTGEAAGTAAALTDDFAALDVSVLQEKLIAQGVKLHENE